MQALGRAALTLGVGLGAYLLVDNAMEYAANGFNWAAGTGTVPYLNDIVHGTSGLIDFLSEPAGVAAGLITAYKMNKR